MGYSFDGDQGKASGYLREFSIGQLEAPEGSLTVLPTVPTMPPTAPATSAYWGNGLANETWVPARTAKRMVDVIVEICIVRNMVVLLDLEMGRLGIGL